MKHEKLFRNYIKKRPKIATGQLPEDVIKNTTAGACIGTKVKGTSKIKKKKSLKDHLGL